MNFTESFQEFSSKVTPTDLALYAGVGLVLWVLFKDKLSPVQKLIGDLVSKVKGGMNLPKVDMPSVVKESGVSSDDHFFDLIVSWKQTRDLAVKSGCPDAVKVADNMFPYLAPVACGKNGDETNE